MQTLFPSLTQCRQNKKCGTSFADTKHKYLIVIQSHTLVITPEAKLSLFSDKSMVVLSITFFFLFI